jgi:cob(I)alamin adenosyltransferase
MSDPGAILHKDVDFVNIFQFDFYNTQLNLKKLKFSAIWDFPPAGAEPPSPTAPFPGHGSAGIMALVERGLVQVYTGEGKGKTTAALGLALRACGSGLKVFLAQFAKGRPSGELASLARLADQVTVRQYGREGFIIGEPTPEDRRLARAGWQEVRQVAAGGEHDLLILDEIGTALRYGLVGTAEVLELAAGKPATLELVLTGRDMPPEILERADLITEMRLVKHYFALGVPARKGIEY